MDGWSPPAHPVPTYLQVFAHRPQELVRGLSLAQRHKEELPGSEKGICARAAPSVTAQSPPGTETLQGLPQHCPALTFSPLAVRMLIALGTSSAVLVFLRAEMEATGTTACAGGGGGQAVSPCSRLPPVPLPAPPAPRPLQPHLDVLEQEVGVEADVAGGQVEAAVVGHFSLPGAREAAQQRVLLGELPEGPAVAAVLLAQLREVGGLVLGAGPGTAGTLQPLAPSPRLHRNRDELSLGSRPKRASSRAHEAGAGVLLLSSGTPRLTEGDGGPCLPVAACSVSLQEDS